MFTVWAGAMVDSLGSRKGFVVDVPFVGVGNAGLVGPDPVLFLKGLLERRGEGRRSVVATELAN